MAATTDTTAGSTPLGNPVDRLREAFDRLGSQQKIAFMVTIAALIAVIVGRHDTRAAEHPPSL
jgi:flagellar M-ring protein FliF